MIEECNKLKEDNDYLVKKYKQYNKVIKEANRNNKRLYVETQNKKQGAVNNKTHLNNNLLLDIQNNNAMLNQQVQEMGMQPGIDMPNLGVNKPARENDIQDEIIER